MFHHAGPPPPGARRPHLCATDERLAAHVRTRRRLGYVLTTVTESLAHSAPRVACVTFDDGYVDNRTSAAPVLESLHVPATVFVVTGKRRRTRRALGGGGRRLGAGGTALVGRVEGVAVAGQGRSAVTPTTVSASRG